jgi:hypothetical protein
MFKGMEEKIYLGRGEKENLRENFKGLEKTS